MPKKKRERKATPVASADSTNPPEAHWGARAIARRIGRSERQTFHMLERGQLEGAKKVGPHWIYPETAARRLFDVEA